MDFVGISFQPRDLSAVLSWSRRDGVGRRHVFTVRTGATGVPRAVGQTPEAREDRPANGRHDWF